MTDLNVISAVVVDDDPRLLKSYEVKLEKEGIRATLIGDPVVAVETIRSLRPSVVVLDALMPTKNGWEILRELKSDDMLRDIPVVMVSNLGAEDKEAEALASGAAAFLVKSDTPILDVATTIKRLVQ